MNGMDGAEQEIREYRDDEKYKFAGNILNDALLNIKADVTKKICAIFKKLIRKGELTKKGAREICKNIPISILDRKKVRSEINKKI